MDNKQIMIAQGSTPHLELVLPFEIEEMDDAIFTIMQNGQIKKEWQKSQDEEMEVDSADKAIMRVHMSQADTFALSVGDAEFQLRVRRGDDIDTFLPIPGVVVPSYNKEVLYNES